MTKDQNMFIKNTNVTNADIDADMALNNYAIFKKKWYYWNPR